MTTSTQPPVAFNFNNSEVRTLNIGDAVWFVCADIAEALGYRDAHNAARCLDNDEKGTQIVSTPSGDQSLTIINESGLYALVLRSRKPEARKFAKWVTSEVLPAIRKTGSYTQPALPQFINPTMQGILFTLMSVQFPEGKDRPYAWSRFNNHFSINSYKNLPYEKYMDAFDYIPTMPTKQHAALPDLTSAFLPPDGRYLVSFENGRAGQPLPVPRDACVMTMEQMLKAMNEPNGMFVDTKTLFEFVTATVNRLAQRCEYYENKSKGVPVKLAM